MLHLPLFQNNCWHVLFKNSHRPDSNDSPLESEVNVLTTVPQPIHFSAKIKTTWPAQQSNIFVMLHVLHSILGTLLTQQLTFWANTGLCRPLLRSCKCLFTFLSKIMCAELCEACRPKLSVHLSPKVATFIYQSSVVWSLGGCERKFIEDAAKKKKKKKGMEKTKLISRNFFWIFSLIFDIIYVH